MVTWELAGETEKSTYTKEWHQKPSFAVLAVGATSLPDVTSSPECLLNGLACDSTCGSWLARHSPLPRIYKTSLLLLKDVSSLALFLRLVNLPECHFVLNKPVAILVIWLNLAYCVSGETYYLGGKHINEDWIFDMKYLENTKSTG